MTAVKKLPVQSFAIANQELAAAFGRYLVARNYAAATGREYRCVLSYFLLFLRAQSVVHVDRRTVRQCLWPHRAKGRSARSLAGLRSALRTFYKFLMFCGIVRDSPAQYIDVQNRAQASAVSVGTDAASVMAAGGTPRDTAILELAYATGLRRGELAKLEVADLDLENCTLRVRGGKGNKDRVGCFGQKALRAVRAHLSGREAGSCSVSNLVYFGNRKSCRRSAGLAGVHTHSLRHAFATHLLNRGLDLGYVQELLGHASVRTTQIYAHTAIADLKRVHSQCHPEGNAHAEKED